MRIYHCQNPEENPIPLWLRMPKPKKKIVPEHKIESRLILYPKNATYPLAEYVKQNYRF